MERHESHSLIRLEGECVLNSAADLKSTLLEGFAAGKDLHLDLESAGEIDITVLQLLWAAGGESKRTGVGIAIRVSEAAGLAAREVGFELFPCDPLQA